VSEPFEQFEPELKRLAVRVDSLLHRHWTKAAMCEPSHSKSEWQDMARAIGELTAYAHKTKTALIACNRKADTAPDAPIKFDASYAVAASSILCAIGIGTMPASADALRVIRHNLIRALAEVDERIERGP
jgi:hypothetical protein